MKNLVEALYSRLLLRDFFGKIIPGAVFLTPVALLVFKPAQFAKLDHLSLGVWLLLLGLSWMTAFAIQSFGESFNLIRYYPRRSDTAGMTEEEERRFWYKRYAETRKYYEVFGQELERLTVILEACGNMYLSLLAASPLYLILLLFLINIWHALILIVVYILVGWFLRRVHFQQVERHADMVETVLALPKLEPSTPTASDQTNAS